MNNNKIVTNDGQVIYRKPIKYGLNFYFTKLSENIYEQLGVPYAKTNMIVENGNKLLETHDVSCGNDIFFGQDITSNRNLIQVKQDIVNFLISKNISPDNIVQVWNDFLNMTIADIFTSNTDRTKDNWGIIIKDNIAFLAPTFDYDRNFQQKEKRMEDIARLVEKDNKNVLNKLLHKYNAKRLVDSISYIINNKTGLYLGAGNETVYDMDLENGISYTQYKIDATLEYICSELGPDKLKEILSKVNIEQALPDNVSEDKYKIYPSLAMMYYDHVEKEIEKALVAYEETQSTYGNI